MLDYLFFNQSVADKFIAFMLQHEIEWVQETEKIQNAIVLKTSDDIDDALWDQLDELYDALNIEDSKLSDESSSNEDEQATAGVYIQLKNNQQTVAQVDPLIMNRILDVISMDELNDFIEAIVSSVENPDEGSICQRESA